MKPPRPEYAAAADLLRALCVGLVGWYHIWQQSWLSPVLSLGAVHIDLTGCVRAGYMFVDLMLVLSGFLLYLPYANRAERPAGPFYLRRGLRILPSYWLCLLVMLAFSVAAPDFSNPGQLAEDLLAHLGFVHNLWGFSYNGTRLNVVLWTLAVEVQFYLVFPALAPVFRRRPVVTYLAMTGAGLSVMLLWTLPMQDTTLFVNRLPNMLVVYANGMLGAHLYARLCKMEKYQRLRAAAATALWVASAWGIFAIVTAQSHASGYDALRAGQLRWRWLLSACGAGFLVGGSLGFGALRAALSNRVVRFLAGISYNFYIWHQWLAVKLKAWRVPPYRAEINPNMAGEMPWQLHYTLLCFASALMLATALTYLVERPAARIGLRRLEGKIAANDDRKEG